MNTLTPTDCLRYINRNLGAAMQIIELSEDEIMRIVFQETLPTFSKYFPFRVRGTIKTKDKVPGSQNRYFITDPEFDKLHIQGINRYWIDNVAYYGNTMVSHNYDPISQQLMSDAISATITPVTVFFHAPNIFEIRPYVFSLHDILVELNCEHSPSLVSIPLGYREWFLKLAYYDVLVSLLPLRKRFDNISTPYGQIQLFLEAMDSSVQDRKDLLETFQENILKDSEARRIWIA